MRVLDGLFNLPCGPGLFNLLPATASLCRRGRHAGPSLRTDPHLSPGLPSQGRGVHGRHEGVSSSCYEEPLCGRVQAFYALDIGQVKDGERYHDLSLYKASSYYREWAAGIKKAGSETYIWDREEGLLGVGGKEMDMEAVFMRKTTSESLFEALMSINPLGKYAHICVVEPFSRYISITISNATNTRSYRKVLKRKIT